MSQADFGPYIECSLAVAVDLVNTAHDGHDHLDSVAALDAFVEEHGLSDAPKAHRQDLEATHELRQALRTVFVSGDEGRASTILNELLASSGAHPTLTNHGDGPWHLHYTPAGAPLAARLTAESAMSLAVIIAQGEFHRLRTCDSDTCQDVFVDASKNRSRRYCSPEVCGNRASVRAYRERKRARTTA